jgi:hypothetical protein
MPRLLATCASLAVAALCAGSAGAATPYGYVGPTDDVSFTFDMAPGRGQLVFSSPALITSSLFDPSWKLFFQETADVGDYSRTINGQPGSGLIDERANPHGFIGNFSMPFSYTLHGCCVLSHVAGVGDVMSGFTDVFDYRDEQVVVDAHFAPGSEGQPFFLNFTALPEPASWALALLGFSLIGTALRGRPRTA